MQQAVSGGIFHIVENIFLIETFCRRYAVEYKEESIWKLEMIIKQTLGTFIYSQESVG